MAPAMHPVPRRLRFWKSARRFLRLCLPADPKQLLFLGGLVCLTVAPHFPWVPRTPEGFDRLATRFSAGSKFGLSDWVVLTRVALLPLLGSAIAGYWAAFRPGPNPTHRILTWVIAPASVALSGISIVWLYLPEAPRSVLERSFSWRRSPAELVGDLWLLGPGLLWALLGLLLVAIFAALLWRGEASLPLALKDRATQAANEEGWPRVEVLVWAILGLQAVVLSAISTSISSLLLRSTVPELRVWVGHIGPFVEIAVLLGICWTTIGLDEMTAVWRSVWPAKPAQIILGAFLPVLLATVYEVVQYLPQRIEWATQNFGKMAPPAFHLPIDRFDFWSLLTILGVFAEEFVFRGVLHRWFLERYGMFRGITLVGVLWGAFHFPVDHYSSLSMAGTVASLFSRVAVCLAIGFVLSWLTLRARSILPATLAHAISNILIGMGFFHGLGLANIPRGILWAVLAYLLFHYGPPRCDQGAGALPSTAEPNSEPGSESIAV